MSLMIDLYRISNPSVPVTFVKDGNRHQTKLGEKCSARFS